MIWIGDRKVYVRTGAKTQTVNVCTSENSQGAYETKFRISPPVDGLEPLLQDKAFREIRELVRFVSGELRGRLEGVSPRAVDGQKLPQHKILRQNTETRHLSWETSALTVLEQSIDQLVLDFVRNPYLHRVEHSIHAELYRLLSHNRILSEAYAGRGFATQAIHKEWPEFKPRPEKGNRRGNFDICLLSPECIGRASRLDFRGGHIEPFAAVEMGLDYSFKHLADDCRKLANSEIENGYAIHLVREDVTDDFERIEAFLAETSTKTAYARIMGNSARYKLTTSSSIEEVALENA